MVEVLVGSWVKQPLNWSRGASHSWRGAVLRTEVLISASGALSRELSHGHGLKGACFRGVLESWDTRVASI